MVRHTSSPQPQAVERKDKHPKEANSNLAGSEHHKNKTNKRAIKKNK